MLCHHKDQHNYFNGVSLGRDFIDHAIDLKD